MTAWDRLFAGWQEAISAHEIKRMQRHIEHLQATMGPHPTHSPQRPHERTSGEPAQGPHLVEIAGPNGSGKTTVMRRTVDLSWFPGARGVDADALAAALPGGFVKPGTRRATLAAERHRHHPRAVPPGYSRGNPVGGARRCDSCAQQGTRDTVPTPSLSPRATRPSMPIASLDVTWRTGPIPVGHGRSLLAVDGQPVANA